MVSGEVDGSPSWGELAKHQKDLKERIEDMKAMAAADKTCFLQKRLTGGIVMATEYPKFGDPVVRPKRYRKDIMGV